MFFTTYLPRRPDVQGNKGPKLRPTLKKSLFPVQRVAIIVASREAAKSFFYIYIFFSLYRNDGENDGEKRKNLENVKKMYPFGTCKLTRAVDRKQNNF